MDYATIITGGFIMVFGIILKFLGNVYAVAGRIWGVIFILGLFIFILGFEHDEGNDKGEEKEKWQMNY